MEYMPRMADDMLKKKLSAKRAVLLEGAKWCGKTTTASQQAGSILYMQDPDRLTQNLELARLKPSRLLQGRSPCMIDEWQIVLTGGIPFAVTLPKVPEAVNADVMTNDELKAKLLKGYDDIDAGNVNDAEGAFKKFRERHG